MCIFLLWFPVIESKTLQGDTGEHSFNAPGMYIIENTTVEFQKGPERETIKIPGPLGADFIIKVRHVLCAVPRFCLEIPISSACPTQSSRKGML